MTKVAVLIAFFIFIAVAALSCGPRPADTVLDAFNNIWPGTINTGQFTDLVDGTCEYQWSSQYHYYYCHGKMQNWRVNMGFRGVTNEVINSLTLTPLVPVRLGDIVARFGAPHREGHPDVRCNNTCLHVAFWELENDIRVVVYTRTYTQNYVTLDAPVHSVSIVMLGLSGGPR